MSKNLENNRDPLTGRPIVNIVSNTTQFRPGKNYTLQCVVLAYPQPSVEWIYQPCESKSSCSKGWPMVIKIYELNVEQKIHLMCYLDEHINK